MIVRELITRLGFRLDQGNLSKAEQGVQRLKTQADAAAGAFRNMALAFVSIASIRSIITIGDEMQSLRARVGMLPTTVGDAGLAIDEMAKHANKASQDINAYGSFFVKAGNATQDFIKDQETLLKVVDGAAFGLAAGGATAVEQKQAFFQLGQAIGSPTVQMEEMNTLIDTAPDLFRALGKAIPGANGNLKAFISTGKVTGKMLAEGLIAVMPEFEAKMKQMPLTVGQATTRVSNKFKLMIDNMNRSSSFITTIANAITDGFDYIEKAVYKTVEAFGGFSNMMRFVGIAIGIALGAKTVQIVRTFGMAFLKASLPIIAITAAVLLAALAVDDFITYINGGNSVIGEFIQYINNGSIATALLKYALIAVGAAFSAVAIIIGAQYLVALASTIVGYTVLGVTAISTGIKMAAAWLVAFWPITLILGAIGTVIAGLYFLYENWESISTSISDLMASAANSILSYWENVKSWFTGFFGWFGEKYEAMKGFIGLGSDQTTAAVGGAGGVSPASMAPSAMGQGGNTTKNETNVTVTVPPGTTAEQAKFLQDSAQKSFGMSSDKYARDLGVYAP
jgi:tape measure domain-containing protein